VTLIDELFTVSLMSARYQAEKHGKPWLYELLLKYVEPRTAAAQARYDRSVRYWANKPEEHKFNLHNYFSKPLAMFFDAHRNHGNNVHGLALESEYITTEKELTPGVIAVTYHSVPRIFVVDDLVYFIDNCKAIVADLVKQYEAGKK